MAQLDMEAAPDRLRKGAGRYPQPVALLARLGVDTGHEGRGLGAPPWLAVGPMLPSAKTLVVGEHSSTRRVRSLGTSTCTYPKLEQSPTDELHLVLLLKDARRTLLGE